MIGPQPSRENINARAALLPLAAGGELLDDMPAEQMLLDVGITNPHIIKNIGAQVDKVIDELRPHWINSLRGYELTEGDIFTLAARSIRRGAAQAASDIGHATADIKELEARLNPALGSATEVA